MSSSFSTWPADTVSLKSGLKSLWCSFQLTGFPWCLAAACVKSNEPKPLTFFPFWSWGKPGYRASACRNKKKYIQSVPCLSLELPSRTWNPKCKLCEGSALPTTEAAKGFLQIHGEISTIKAAVAFHPHPREWATDKYLLPQGQVFGYSGFQFTISLGWD